MLIKHHQSQMSFWYNTHIGVRGDSSHPAHIAAGGCVVVQPHHAFNQYYINYLRGILLRLPSRYLVGRLARHWHSLAKTDL